MTFSLFQVQHYDCAQYCSSWSCIYHPCLRQIRYEPLRLSRKLILSKKLILGKKIILGRKLIRGKKLIPCNGLFQNTKVKWRPLQFTRFVKLSFEIRYVWSLNDYDPTLRTIIPSSYRNSILFACNQKVDVPKNVEKFMID